MGHSVQCRHTDPCLGFLLRQRSRLHGAAENALVALHRKLGIVTQVVALALLPGEAALLCNDLDMVVRVAYSQQLRARPSCAMEWRLERSVDDSERLARPASHRTRHHQ